MSRSTHIIGLPDEAIVFLRENIKHIPEIVCPDCGKIISETWDNKEYDSARDLGMFDDGPGLNEYTLKDSSVVREKVQASPWSSGPCIFLMLVDEDGEILYKWSVEEIESY